MADEFQKTGKYAVASTNGFTVEVDYARGVKYVDSDGDFRIESELLVKPYRMLLYPPRGGPAVLERFERVLPNLRRALDYMGCA